jgi:hypothetical protein
MDGQKEGTVPSPYVGGIGKEGLAALLEFVNDGGTLITLNASAELALTHFKVPLTNVVNTFSPMEFYCPNTLLKIDIDNTHPIAYGMEDTAAVVFNRSPVFTMNSDQEESKAKEPSSLNLKVVARFPGSNPFMSGFLNGEKLLYNKPALVDVSYGKGKIIIFGFRPQNRAQTQGTFKLLFNSLYYGPAVTSSK